MPSECDREKRLQSIVSEIRDFCRANADESQAAKYSKYFQEGYDGYGVPRNVWEEHQYDFYKAHKDELGLNGFLDLGDLLLQSGKYEEGSIAIVSVARLSRQFTPDAFGRIALWLEGGIRNWAHTDVLSSHVLSVFLQKGIVGLDAMSSWRESPSKWKRRAVPVTMISLLKTAADYGGLLDFIRPLMMDEERAVHQGVGWFLREAWRRQPGPVEAFLHEWKDSAPRLIFQYATEKMTAENRARFRRAKGQAGAQ
ncbi:MAG: DNA alkylation repair protein [Ignavibacteriales bacterium]